MSIILNKYNLEGYVSKAIFVYYKYDEYTITIFLRYILNDVNNLLYCIRML